MKRCAICSKKATETVSYRFRDGYKTLRTENVCSECAEIVKTNDDHYIFESSKIIKKGL